jgi:hypothetical protein
MCGREDNVVFVMIPQLYFYVPVIAAQITPAGREIQPNGHTRWERRFRQDLRSQLAPVGHPWGPTRQ